MISFSVLKKWLRNWKDAAVRRVKAGGFHAGLGYLADVVDPAPRLDAEGAAGIAAGIAGSFLPPFGMARASGGDAEALARLI
mgnify:CR=1 FL=1